MALLFVISVICFALSFVHFLTKPIVAFALRPSRAHRKLTAEIADLQHQMSQLSMQHDYTAYIKLERKLQAAKAARQQQETGKLPRSLIIRYGTQALLALTLVVVSIAYRNVPVIVLGDHFNFTPFGWLMRFPTGISGAVSAPFWIFVNSFVAKGVASACGQ